MIDPPSTPSPARIVIPDSADLPPIGARAMGGPKLVTFVAGEREFAVEEILRAADFRGRLHPIREDVRAGLACEQSAGEEGFEVSVGALRYDFDRETAEATEAWLEIHQRTRAGGRRAWGRKDGSRRNSRPENVLAPSHTRW